MDDSREQFSRKSDIENELVPFGPIGIISLKGTEEMARTID